MTDTLTRSDAIDRMRDGLPCETQYPSGSLWVPTEWVDFANKTPVFRIPPEPRREAREFAVWDCNGMWRAAEIRNRNERNGAIHVREVLPDEVVVRRMTTQETHKLFITLGRRELCATTFAACVHALGLLKEPA